MTGDHWQIEHNCPQCGAPVTLDETDRLLVCPFCRTRLYLAAQGHFCYHIPPAAGAGGELLYIPYWRFRGTSFSAAGGEVTHRFVDTSALAVRLPGLPPSLGLRPQVLKLRFTSPSSEGRFIAPDLTAGQVFPDRDTAPPGVFFREFIGETTSLIHAPFFLKGEILCDAVLGRPVSGCRPCDAEQLLNAKPSIQGQIRFIPTHCPHCGWDMEGERDALVLTCRNCNSAWTCPEETFSRVEFAVKAPPPTAKEIAVYLPFWRMKPRFGGIALSSYADLIRLANLPRAVTPAFEAMPLFFWSPAFKVNPALYLRWARQMTTFRPAGREDDRLPGSSLYPVTLALREAAESIPVTLAQMIADKRKFHPKLADLNLSLEESRLEYHPFTTTRTELLHATMGVSLDRTALAYGIRM